MSENERDKLLDHLTEFVRSELAGGLPPGQITATAPLLKLGVLDSIRTTQLMAHIRDEFGVRVPPLEMTGENFQTLEAVTDLLLRLRDQSTIKP